MTIRTTARVAGPFSSAASTLPFAFKVYKSTDLRVVCKAPERDAGNNPGNECGGSPRDSRQASARRRCSAADSL